MTDEQINALAREYAEKSYHKVYNNLLSIEAKTDEAVNVIQWLSARYRIVPKINKRMCLRDKSKVCDLCHKCDIDISQPRY